MSTCVWCTPGGSNTAELLESYAAKGLKDEEFNGANDDLSYCMECVVEYHKARDKVPQLHKALWMLETSRLVAQLQSAMREEIEEDDELFLVEEDGEKQLFGYSGCNFESNVRVPLLEILKFPYLLLDKDVSELSIEALCKMEQANNTFQVFDKLPGVYLLLVHPNETIRRWAISTAQAQGKVDRDDFYDLEEVFTCLFKVIELGLFENPDIYMYSELEDGKLILLPSHLYDTSNYKNYWLGICMLLTVLEEQAMASLLLGPNKQNDFMQSILHVMEKQTEDEGTNPFWPALHCFMTILDRLGSKVWGQLIDPVQAFQTIIASPSYNNEIENIRNSCQRSTKCEPEPTDEDFFTCSQAVYSYNTEKVKKEAGWKSAICPDYCPNMYEDMQSLANILQSDIGQDMRVHNSTFLWFIPYVQSVMDLKDLGVAYIMEVIHHLSSEIKVVLSRGSDQCDKVTELFVRVLVSIIELHRSKKCLHFLWISSRKWVEAIVKCAMLPATSPGLSSTSAQASPPASQTTSSVQLACILLIRTLLREGCQLGQQATCKQYLDKCNLIIRGNVIKSLDLSKQEDQGLQTCLTQIIKGIKDKASSVSYSVDAGPASPAQAVPFIKTEKMDVDYESGNTSPYSSSDVHPLERRDVLKNYIKKEPTDKSRKDSELNPPPGCSSLLKTRIKKEKLDDPNTSSSEMPKRLLSGWQSKLSKIVAKVPKRTVDTSECSPELAQEPSSDKVDYDDISSDEDLPLTELVKKRLNKSQQTVSDSLPVSEQLRKLSLDNNLADRAIKGEFQEGAKVGPSGFIEGNTDCEMDDDDRNDGLPSSEERKKPPLNDSKMLAAQIGRIVDHITKVEQIKDSDISADAEQKFSESQEFSSIRRKVKGASRALDDEDASSKTELLDQIITISDDSDQEDESFCKSIKTEKVDYGKTKSKNSIQSPKQVKSEPDDQSLDEYGSQCFEFETKDDIFSAWTDSQLEEPKVGQNNNSSKPEPSDDDLDLNHLGYDTEYVSDDLINKAAEDAEEQFKAYTSSAVTQSRSDESVNASPHLSSNKFYGKRSHESASDKDHKRKQPKLVKNKSLHSDAETPVAKSSGEKRKSKSPLKLHGHGRKNKSPAKGALAVVPPKKIHMCPEPGSAVEKLRLKKPPRKAFDLSQRSLDSLAELRDYGKSVGCFETTRKRKSSKLISPQPLSVKGNKKMLASQELQFHRQSRPKDTEKRRLNSGPENDRGKNSKHSGHKPGDQTSGDQTSVPRQRKRTEKTEGHRNEEPHGHGVVDTNKNISKTTEETNGHAVAKMEPQASSSAETNIYATVPATAVSYSDQKEEEEEDDEDDQNLFLTQADPCDMDLCSQLENEIFGPPQDMFSSNVVDHSPSVSQDTEAAKCCFKDCTELVTGSSNKCSKHSSPEKEDHVFAKPGLPPSLQKPARPSTTKVFSSGASSRTASLTKDLESLPKQLPTPKPKILASKPAIPRHTMEPCALYKPLVPRNPSNVLQPLINQNNIPVRSGYDSFSGTGKNPLVAIQTLPRDQNWLLREVLHWTYEMFDNVAQFGPPNSFSQLPLMKVPLRFSSFEEYFNIFAPLMLRNTFETLAQDWVVKQPALEANFRKLQLQSFFNENSVNRGEFQGYYRDAEPSMQCLPKEGDLVFLRVREFPGTSPGEEGDAHEHLLYYTGYVSRFMRSQRTQMFEREQYTLCDLGIQTYANLLPYCKQQVDCAVIGSLITTQRQFRGLNQLQRNPLFRSIIHPTQSDFLPRDKLELNDNLSPISKEYNSCQRNAIEKAYAMVKLHPRLPRTCIIHGPPGTGKSKTIVGLLYRILMERQSTVPDQNFNAKNKRNRVLVCAPSNAALDDLMKKIIVEFKEKCRDKKNTLGNCGDINLVRLGLEKTISADVVRFSLDSQVSYRINRAVQDPNILRQKESLDKQLDDLSRQRAMERCNKNTCVELDQKIAKVAKERQFVANVLKEHRRRPQEVQRNIILESHVICCTLSTSGGILLESAFRQLGQEPFSCVIVDEAGQSCEVETLIPLLHRCCKLVLVGDPQQLPPTTISVKAEELGYGQSMMSRFCQILEACGSNTPVLQLTTQYRMHPDICLFPSKYFYNSKLKTDSITEEIRCSSDWPFQPYMVFDVSDGKETKDKESFFNLLEIEMVVALIKLIKSKKKDFCFRNIGIITPYRAQKIRIADQLKKTFNEASRPGEVDTVDGFQGQQRDCIIVTCVRANSNQAGIGFLACRERLNVTITRAKFSLFILGNLRTLMENKEWYDLIQDAQRRGALVKTKKEHFQKDVNKILKLKPVKQNTSVPQSGSSHSSPTETPYRDNNKPLLPGGPPPKKIIAHPAVRPYNSTVSMPERTAPSNGGLLPIPSTSSGKLRDPRLAHSHRDPRWNNQPPPSGPQQSSDARRSQGRIHPLLPPPSASGPPRYSRSLSDDSSYRQPRNEDRNRDHRSNKDQDPKRRKMT